MGDESGKYDMDEFLFFIIFKQEPDMTGYDLIWLLVFCFVLFCFFLFFNFFFYFFVHGRIFLSNEMVRVMM